MRSVVLDFDRRRVIEDDIPEPQVADPHHVLFRVHEVGVCGTDRELAAFRMRPRERDARRIVIGHEAVGEVLACGEAVTTVSPGDCVVPTIRRSCVPACSSCARRRSDLCLTARYSERGIFNLDGYFTAKAVDLESDLVPVPPSLAPYAVLLEPLSVVEKAASRIDDLRQSDGRDALVLGLGPVGILMAMVLTLRGFKTTVYSLEPDDHPRTAILRDAGVAYRRTLDGRYDVIVEAAGSAELALAAVKLLAPCGVMITLGAQRVTGEISFIDLIVGNQTVAGIVNASRGFFERGARDLGRFPEKALRRMIRRHAFGDWLHTLTGSAAAEPKSVHAIA